MAFSKCLKIKQGKDKSSGMLLHQYDMKTLLNFDELVINSLNVEVAF